MPLTRATGLPLVLRRMHINMIGASLEAHLVAGPRTWAALYADLDAAKVWSLGKWGPQLGLSVSSFLLDSAQDGYACTASW